MECILHAQTWLLCPTWQVPGGPSWLSSFCGFVAWLHIHTLLYCQLNFHFFVEETYLFGIHYTVYLIQFSIVKLWTMQLFECERLKINIECSKSAALNRTVNLLALQTCIHITCYPTNSNPNASTLRTCDTILCEFTPVWFCIPHLFLLTKKQHFLVSLFQCLQTILCLCLRHFLLLVLSAARLLFTLHGYFVGNFSLQTCLKEINENRCTHKLTSG